MPKIADVLERESRTVDLEQGDFERFLGRRERKQRNQRIRAGALGIVVALAAGIVLVRALTSNQVPANPPVEPTPAPPVVSGALVYALHDDLWVADPDGTNAVRITDVGALDDECPGDVGYHMPSWSPDGRYIASGLGSDCSSVGPLGPGTDGPVPGVVITDPQGDVVANFPMQGHWIAWSPDSTRVAVWDEYSPGALAIGIYGIDGTRETQIAIPPGWEPADMGELSWMPDGASLIVDQLELPLDGGTPRELPFLQPPSSLLRPLTYSPDGSQVAYATLRALMVARSDGSEPRELWSDGSPRDPSRDGPYTAAWSPTGELIAVTADGPGDPWAPNQLHVVDLATGSATLLFEGERRTMLIVTGFSPEGDRILFSSFGNGGSGPFSLWSAGVDGSDARPIVAGTIEGAWRST